MAEPNEFEFHTGDLEQVVDSVFTTMMGIEARRGADAWPSVGHVMTASIRLRGRVEGTILMHYYPTQACEFTGSFLGMPAPASVNEDVLDVLRELANIVAGNLKCTLGPGVLLSIPTVREEDGLPSNAFQRRSAFDTRKGPFWMTVLKGADQAD